MQRHPERIWNRGAPLPIPNQIRTHTHLATISTQALPRRHTCTVIRSKGTPWSLHRRTMIRSKASSAPTAANGTMSASHFAARRTKSGSSFHSSL